jgi:hypothetical protein
MRHARASSEQIAAALGISEDAFKAWCQRLTLGRAWAALPPMPVAKGTQTRGTRGDPRIRAQRLFEGEALDGRNAASIG